MSYIPWIVIAVYIIVVTAIGIFIGYRKKAARDMESYFNADKSLSSWAVALSVTGMAISGVVYVGVPGNCYANGWTPYLAAALLGSFPGILGTNLLSGRPIRIVSEKLGSYSVTDLCAKMFKERRLSYPSVPAMVIFSIAMLMVQWVTIGNLFTVFLEGVDYTTCMILGVVMVSIYCVIGGNNSNSYVCIAQMLIAVVVSVSLGVFAIHLDGGFVKLNYDLARINPEYVQFGTAGYPMSAAVSVFLMYFLGYIGNPGSVSKYFGIKDKRSGAKCALIQTVSMLLIQFVIFGGLCYRIMAERGVVPFCDNTDTVFPSFVKYFTNPWVSGIVMAAALAAIMSTASTIMITTSSTMVQDILGEMLHKDISGAKGVRYSRISMIIVILLSAVAAIKPNSDILSMGSATFGCFAAVFTPTVFFGLRWRRATKQGALASMWCGLIFIVVTKAASILFGFVWPTKQLFFNDTVWGIFLSIAVFVIVSLATPYQEKDYLPPTRKELKTMKYSPDAYTA